MNLDDYRKQMTNGLARDIIESVTCSVRNSEGKLQTHDWGDPYSKLGWQRWFWKIRYPVLKDGYQNCIRCGYTSRRLR